MIFNIENQREKHQIKLKYKKNIQIYYTARKYKIDSFNILV